MVKIIVTGANGQLGQELRVLSSRFPHCKFYFFERGELDISKKEEVANIFQKLEAQYCINCAAYTAVDKAESEKDAAFKINAVGTQNLALAATATGTKLFHISTDYVFDGTAQTPYKEDDPTKPTSVYGASKLKGEELCLEANSNALIIRTSWVYSEFGNNFVKTMLRLMPLKPELRVVNDQWGAPTYAADLAQAIMHIIESGKWVSGIYHFSNDGITNWFDLAKAIAAGIATSCVIIPISSKEYPTPVRRPAYSVLDKEKIQSTFGVTLQPWERSLAICLSKLGVKD